MTSIIQKKPPAPRPPVRPPVTPPVRPPVTPSIKPPVTPRPGPIRADDTGRVPPSERTPKVQTPSSQKDMTPPQYVPMGPSKPAVSGGNMGKAAINAGMASRVGTPISVKDAPGYRGIGTPTMPSSSMLGAKKGGAISTSKISTASKNKNQCNW